MTHTVGIFVQRRHEADLFWNHCDGPAGRHGDLEFRNSDAKADTVISFAAPICPIDPPRLGRWRRRLAKLTGSLEDLRARTAWSQLARPRDHTFAIFYEPPPAVTDTAYATAREFCSRVYGPDPRATHPIVLPVTWWLHEDVATLRPMEPDPKPLGLVAITSGENALPGHRERLEFLYKLRRANIPFELFGRNIPAHLAPRGQVMSKSAVLRPARFALVIENYAEGSQYVTEKLWDALLCWCLPLYWGSTAADLLIPAEAMVRLPDLGGDGVEAVRAALADPGLWERRLGAMREARRRALGEWRFTEWVRRLIAAGS